MNLPIDVVSSVQVISNPYDPEYGKFTGAVSSVETKPGNLDKLSFFDSESASASSAIRDGDIVGLESVTPRLTVTGPLVKNRVAITQSFEYRFVRTPVQSLPPLRRDMKLETFDSFTQVDLALTETHTATLSLSVFPAKARIPGAEHIYAAGIDPRPAPARLSGLRDRTATSSGTGCLPPRSTTRNMTPTSCRTAPLRTGSCWRPREGGFFDRPEPAKQPLRVAGNLPDRSSAIFSARTL